MLTILGFDAEFSVQCFSGTRTNSGSTGPREFGQVTRGPGCDGITLRAYYGRGCAKSAFCDKILLSIDTFDSWQAVGESLSFNDTQPGYFSGWFGAQWENTVSEASIDTLLVTDKASGDAPRQLSSDVASACHAWNTQPHVAYVRIAREFVKTLPLLNVNLEHAAAWLEHARHNGDDRRKGSRGRGDNVYGMLVLTLVVALVLTAFAVRACDTLWLYLGWLMASAFSALSVVQNLVYVCTSWTAGGVGALWSAGAGLFGSAQNVGTAIANLTLLVCAHRGLEPSMVRIALATAWFVQPVGAVCSVCHGFFEGCTGGDDGSKCAGAAAVVGNAAAIAAAGTAALTLVGLFDVRVLRVFTSPVLAVLKQYALAPVAGTPFDFEGRTNAQVVNAVLSGSLSKNEALRHFTAKIDTVAALAEEGPRTAQLASVEAQLRLLQAVDERPSTSSSPAALAGVMHFVWGKCSEVVLGGEGKITLGTDTEKKSASTVTTRILVPTKADEFFEILALWQAIVVQVGLAPLMVVHSVVQRTVWHPIRTVKMPWVVAHELLLAHLDRVDQSVDRSVRLANVCDKVGVDVLRAEAIEKAHTRFGTKFQSDIFRFSGGARAPSGEHDLPGVVYNGKSSKNSTRPCEAFNRGVDHLAKHLHPDGTCKFKHACGKWIKMPDGTVGYCLRAHPMGQCDRDPAECSKVGPGK